MIIDTHVHIGDMIGFHMTEEDVLYSMQQYGIDHSIVSCLDAAEFDHELRLIPSKYCQPPPGCGLITKKPITTCIKPSMITANTSKPSNFIRSIQTFRLIPLRWNHLLSWHSIMVCRLSSIPAVRMPPRVCVFIIWQSVFPKPVLSWCIWDSAPITKKLLNWSPDSRISMVIRPGYLCKAPCCSFRPQELKRSCSAVITPLTALTPICITVMVTVLFIRIIFMYCPVCFLPKITTASCTRMPPTSSEFLFTKPSFAAYFFSRTKIFKTDSLTTDYRSFLWQTARQKEPHRNAARKRQP